MLRSIDGILPQPKDSWELYKHWQQVMYARATPMRKRKVIKIK